MTDDKIISFVDRRREELEQLWKETLREYGDDPSKLLEISKAALEEYPRDKTFLFRAAVDEERLAQMPAGNKSKGERLGSAMEYVRRLLDEEPELEIAKELMARIRLQLG